jgi:tetratricopeptide (TPR) repeat protein
MEKLFRLYLLKVLITLLFFPYGKINGQSLSVERIYEKVKDAVVVIYAYDYSDELAAQGSGVVINDKGYVVTNYHVLSGCERIEIIHGEEIIPYVDIIGIDVEKDILILKIEDKKFPYVKIGDVKSLKVGQRVYAIGSPMGFENTISEGIISGLRSYEELSKNYIQITASISHGSSGGAVVNDKGELIGISTLTAEEGQNLNFAIPIDEVLNVEISSYSKNETFKDFEWISKGLKAYESGNNSDAIKYFSKFIELQPSYFEAYYNRGTVKLKMADYRGAIEDFSKAVEINPYDEDVYYNRGIAKENLEDFSGAIKDLTLTIDINPYYWSAYYIRGLCKHKLDNYYEAILDYTKAININPYFEAYYNRGLAKRKLEDNIGAIQDYTKAIELKPSDPATFYNRGLAKYYAGDKYGACLDWSKAGELGDDDVYDLIREYCN